MDVATGVATGDRRKRGYDQHVTSGEIIEEIRVRISRAAPPDSRVILFGSRARGEADDGSDFDVLVIEPEVEDTAREAVRLRRQLRDVLAPIDVVVVDRELARRRAAVRGTMVERALREGRVLADT
jgi:predicted nucleotidyltransferase